VDTPQSAYPASAQNVADMAAATSVAQRLRRIWPGNDVGILTKTGEVIANTDADVHDLMNELNKKYSVYDKFSVAKALRRRASQKNVIEQLEVNADGHTPVEADYKSVFNNANVKTFNPKFDNPDNLEMMLSSLWGKRYGYMNLEQKDDAARNEKVLIVKATSKETERLSQGISTDGSVNSFVARADDAAELRAQDPEALQKPQGPFKPKSYWYGPDVYGVALDITGEQVPANSTSRAPSSPPKPPVASYVFPEFDSKDQRPGATPITIIETITVTKPKDEAPLNPQNTFTPIMTNDLQGATEKPYTV